MTLRAREQDIRREKASSNICTNQGLLALRCTIYLALLGKNGLPGLAKICYNNAQYAAHSISKLKKFNIYQKNHSFIKEFVIETDLSAKKIQTDALKYNILIDIPKNDTSDSKILLAFTEKRTKEEINTLVSFLSEYK